MVQTQIPVFIINLDSSPERFADAERQLVQLGIRPMRFAGVYGKALAADEINACYDTEANRRKFRRSLSLGEIGCYLSHRGVWQQMVDQQIPWAIVLEDDIDVEAKLIDAMAQIDQLTGWDHIKISDDRATPSQQMDLAAGFKLVNFKRTPNCATGYAMSLAGAQKLLSRQKFFRPVDIDLQYGSEFDLQLFSLLPYTIWPSSRFDSVINAMTGGTRKGDTTFWRNLKYRLTMLWQRHRHLSGDLTKISRKQQK